MDLFDRVKLLVRSTLSSGLPEFSSTGKGDPQKMLDTAEAKLEILRDDLARAEKKGNDELAGKLKVEIADLEKLIAQVRRKAQPAKNAPASQPIEPAETPAVAQPARVETKPTQTPSAAEKPVEKPQETATPADVVIDETRVADLLKKMREGK